MRHPLRATISALLAARALTSAGVPAEGGILLGLALGWLVVAALPDPRERALHRRDAALPRLVEPDGGRVVPVAG